MGAGCCRVFRRELFARSPIFQPSCHTLGRLLGGPVAHSLALRVAGKEFEAAPGTARHGGAVQLPCVLSPAVLVAAPLLTPLLFFVSLLLPQPCPALSPPSPYSVFGAGPEMSRFRQRLVEMGRQVEECWFDHPLRLKKARHLCNRHHRGYSRRRRYHSHPYRYRFPYRHHQDGVGFSVANTRNVAASTI